MSEEPLDEKDIEKINEESEKAYKTPTSSTPPKPEEDKDS